MYNSFRSFKSFRCPECKKAMPLPGCACGYTAKSKNGIYQLTDAPYIVKDDSAEVKYIGYEEIGEYYSGKSLFEKAKIDEKMKKTAELAGDGVLLDLACGDGAITVPLAMQGVSVISMDISDKMLSLLFERAKIAGIEPSRLVVCRANALDIPLMDNSVDAAIANSVLHLISAPEIILREIHRVLKKGGKFIAFEDRPGRGGDSAGDLTEEEISDNKKADEYSSFIYGRYFDMLKDEYGIHPKKYSWQFDREKACAGIFGGKTVYTVESKMEKHKNVFKDTFFFRMGGKGFSDQSDVPDEIHKSVFGRATSELVSKYGEKSLNIAWTVAECHEVAEIIAYLK